MPFRSEGARPRHHTLFALTIATVLLAVSACSQQGTPQAEGEVAGLPVTNFESGLRDNAPAPDVEVNNISDSKVDRLAATAVADAVDYWSETFPEEFDERFSPVSEYLSYDPDGRAFEVCEASTNDVPMNAFYCPIDNVIAWDRAQLLPTLNDKFGPIAIGTVLAHEYGHAVQDDLGHKAGFSPETKTIVAEQQADCFAGNYMRWLAQDNSEYFRLSTSQGLNQALSALFFVRDPAGMSPTEPSSHGTAFDRTYAFQLGFSEDPTRCADIDEEKIQERITEAPYHRNDDSEGYAQVTDETVELLRESLDAAFDEVDAPAPRVVSDDGACPDGPETKPASYCPDSNEVHIDMQQLAVIGSPVDRTSENSGLGDFAAYAEIASRYVLAVQQGVGLPLDDDNTALRTACLVGAWAETASEPTGQQRELRLSSGDLDEAIAELLQPNSLIAADVNGSQIPNGFSRVEALREGYLEGSAACTDQYA